jgi:anti-sigma factor RsiW
MTGHWAHAEAAHIETEVLAEYRDGLTGRLRARRIAAHLASCDTCAAANARLAAVTTALAAAAAPPMPAAVAHRLSAAISAAAQTRAEAGPLPADPGAAPQTHDPERGRGGSQRPPWLRPVAVRILASAAVVCLLAGGGYALTRLGSGSNSSAAASSGSAAKPESEKAAGQAGSAITGGPIHAGANDGRSAPSVAFTAIASGTDYQPGQQLLQQVESELSNHAAAKPYAVTKALSDCVDKVAGGFTPAMVDVARYQGQPATIIAVTHLSTSGFAWVMDAGCTRKLAETVLPAAG